MQLPCRRSRIILATATVVAAALPALAVADASAAGTPGQRLRDVVAARLGNQTSLSGGLRMWLAPPRSTPGAAPNATIHFGTNADANNPAHDTAAGQAETGIAAQIGTRGQRLVLTGWNDVSGFFAAPTTRQGSITGVGVSADGGATFSDLIGLPNNNSDQQWSGDPTVASLGDGKHFVVGSLYYPSFNACADGLPAYGTVAVSVATVSSSGGAATATFTAPIPVTLPGNLCGLGRHFPRHIATLDKDWVAYDPSSRTLAVSYTRFAFGTEDTGNGQVEVARAIVPTNPTHLSTADFGKPLVVWPEEPYCPDGVPSSEPLKCGAINTGAYAAVAPGGTVYVAWERNIDSNQFDGDPYVYEHAAVIPPAATKPSAGGRGRPVVLTRGEPHATPDGGVKSLNGDVIPGFNRGTGQDFPRVAYDKVHGRVVFAWNDASYRPLGDIFVRAASFDLQTVHPVSRVDDGSGYALHFLPAISVRDDGTVCTSWYDRSAYGANSTQTDYMSDCRSDLSVSTPDVLVSTGPTDWANTSSLITPNFGDYTDNATDGTTTYYTWSDGRIGVPQPFVDSN